ncbi:MAG TPA: hypothetical protein VLC52_04540, partial [Anaerolineae bacterium]|nr:hypothetical protein [Anaerolineae bacterium]
GAGERLRYLQQIPVFALRQVVNDHFPGDEGEARLVARFRSALARKPRRPRQAVMRLPRHELARLIAACPEIDDAVIAACFEEYRYGSHPSFYIYLFGPGRLAPGWLDGFDGRLAQALVDDNARFAGDVSQGLPPLRDLLLNDFGPLAGAPGLYEGTYRFLSRLDYIDAQENAVSTYETLYGFFWISVADGYVLVHARKPEVLKSLRLAIEEAAGVLLTPLVISKQFKNSLAFLDPLQFRSGKLYEPNPASDRFRWLTIADGKAYEKGYAGFEAAYPELRSTSYRISVAGKDTTVRLTCAQGALTLSGRLQASQFRTWAMDSLGEVIRVLRAMQAEPAAYVQTIGLRNARVLVATYPGALQRDLVLELLSQVLTVKQAGGDTGPLGRPALELALALRGDLAAQITCTCAGPECGEESPLACPTCGETFFTLSERDGSVQLACQKSAQHWRASLPAGVALDCGHEATLNAEDLRDGLELLPGARLLGVMAGLVRDHLGGYQFDPLKEGFYIRGSTLHYYADKDSFLAVLPKDGKTVFINNVIQQIGELRDGQVMGVVVTP